MPIEWDAVKGCWDSDELVRKIDVIDFEMILHRVKIGFDDDARTFLLSCALFLEEGEQLPYSYLAYLAQQFKRMANAENPFDVSLLKREVGPPVSKEIDEHARVAEEVRASMATKDWTVAEAARHVSNLRHSKFKNGKSLRVHPERARKYYTKFFGSEDNIYRSAAIKEVPHRPYWMTGEVLAAMARDGEDQQIQMFVMKSGIKVTRPRKVKFRLLIRRHSLNTFRRRSRR